MGTNLVEIEVFCRRCREEVTLMEKHVGSDGEHDEITAISCVESINCKGSDCKFAGGEKSYTR